MYYNNRDWNIKWFYKDEKNYKCIKFLIYI